MKRNKKIGPSSKIIKEYGRTYSAIESTSPFLLNLVKKTICCPHVPVWTRIDTIKSLS